MEYYNKTYIQFEIIKPCKNREFAIIPKVRALKVHSISDLKKVLELIHWDKNKLKLYRSVAKVREIPFFTFNLKERSSETGPWFANEFDNLIYEYDLFLDFDKDKDSTIYQVLEEVKILLEYFDEYKLPYYIQFSGNKGFQLFIDGKYLPKPQIGNKQIQPHKRIAEKIKEAFDFKYLDIRNNGVGNRLCKVPYSLCKVSESGFEDDMNVVLPLSKEQINNFKLEDMRLGNVMVQVIGLDRRGLIERQENLTDIEKIKNVDNFLKTIDI